MVENLILPPIVSQGTEAAGVKLSSHLPAKAGPTPGHPTPTPPSAEGPDPLPLSTQNSNDILLVPLVPVGYDESIVTEAFDQMSDGVNFRGACKASGLSERRLRRWIAEDNPVGIRERWQAIRRIRAADLADQMLALTCPIDDDELAIFERRSLNSRGEVDSKKLKVLLLGRTQDIRNRLDAMKFLMPRLDREAFGEKLDIDANVRGGFEDKARKMSDAELISVAARQGAFAGLVAGAAAGRMSSGRDSE